MFPQRTVLSRGFQRNAGVSALATRRVTCAKIVLKPIGDLNPDHILRSGMSAPPPATTIEVVAAAAVVGRDEEESDLIIPIPTVSGSHAKVELEDDKLFVTDLSSTNGTYVNDERIKPEERTQVFVGSSIIFGDVNLASFVVENVVDEE